MKPLVENQGVGFHYEIIDTFTAGIKLNGSEVKSLRNKRGKLIGAYITEKFGKLFLVKAFIPFYQIKGPEQHQIRDRELLLTKHEIFTFARKKKEQGLTIVPIAIGLQGQRIVVQCALAKGKKNYDKRQAIKKRDAQRDLARLRKSF